MDDCTWVWELTQKALLGTFENFNKVASNMPLRASWERFKDAPFLIIHWENKHRSGGAIVEEISDIDPHFDIAGKIIVLTTNPIHEDVVFFAELGIRRVIRPRQRENEMAQAIVEIKQQIRAITIPNTKPSLEDLWQSVFGIIQRLPENPPESLITKIEERIISLREPNTATSARELEALASLKIKCSQLLAAEKLLNEAIEANPNYFRAWNKLIDIKRNMGAHEDAYALMQKLQLLNRSSIKRLVAMGEEQLAMKDWERAGYFFQSALDKDGWCAGALNGLAEVRFLSDELEESRRLLSKSSLAYKFAAKLNGTGIELVRHGNFEGALEHYSKAQYVLPLPEKGPQLLYNIALCYIKWGKNSMAEEFLKLAIIKDPSYEKACRTLENIRSKPDIMVIDELDAA